jgi:hypothetical protein
MGAVDLRGGRNSLRVCRRGSRQILNVLYHFFAVWILNSALAEVLLCDDL